MLNLTQFGIYHFNDGCQTLSYFGERGDVYTVMSDGAAYKMRVQSVHGGAPTIYGFSAVSAAVAAIEALERGEEV